MEAVALKVKKHFVTLGCRLWVNLLGPMLAFQLNWLLLDLAVCGSHTAYKCTCICIWWTPLWSLRLWLCSILNGEMSSHQNVSLSSLFSFRTVLSSLSVLISPITQTESQSKDLMLLLRYFVSQMLLVIPSGLLLLFLPKIWGIQGVWVGLTLVMGLRMVAGFARYTFWMWIWAWFARWHLQWFVDVIFIFTVRVLWFLFDTWDWLIMLAGWELPLGLGDSWHKRRRMGMRSFEEISQHPLVRLEVA